MGTTTSRRGWWCWYWLVVGGLLLGCVLLSGMFYLAAHLDQQTISRSTPVPVVVHR